MKEQRYKLLSTTNTNMQHHIKDTCILRKYNDGGYAEILQARMAENYTGPELGHSILALFDNSAPMLTSEVLNIEYIKDKMTVHTENSDYTFKLLKR